MNIVEGQGMPDFVMLQDITEDSFMKNLSVRFFQKQIYTYIGEQIVSMNPFAGVDIYSKETMAKYRNRELYEVQPHIFALADDTFRSLMRTKVDQCVLITGESGAGKTEASKVFMQYIVHISNTRGDGESIKTRLLDSNPVLEAFGNAKTVRNDNSSRFGKYMEIQFDGTGAPMGGKVSQYLLEKSRVVTRAADERSFHIFYQLLSQKDLLSSLQLTDDPKKYAALSISNCYTVKGMNDAKDFAEVKGAMDRLGFPHEDQDSTWRILGSILHLSNLQFKQTGKDQAEVANKDVLKSLAALLKISEAALEKSMTTNEIEAVGQKTEVHLNSEQAAFSRDSFAKAMYDKVFDWVVDRINSSIECQGKPEIVIGVLDIYGFEIFQKNSFEQFCINYCNEKLQQLFIKLVLQQEQAEYQREGIEWKEVKYFDNAPIVELIEGQPNGMFKVLDEACMVGKATPATLLEKLTQCFGKHEHFESWNAQKKDIDRGAFRIKHYAGIVDYQVEEFVFKNTDTLYRTIKNALRSSAIPFLKNMYAVEENTKKRPISAGWQFKLNVNDLVAKLNACQPHYIRCIKSNDKKSGFSLDDERVKHQVRYLNLVETVRVRRAGFCNRQPYTRFLARYKMVSPLTWPKWTGSERDGCKAILDVINPKPDEYRLGKTKVFIRDASTLSQLEKARSREMPKVAIAIQRTWRRLHVKGKALRYMNELVAWYGGQKGNPNFGAASPVPQPRNLEQYDGYSKKSLLNWWGVCRILAMSPQVQAVLREKVRTYNLFHGRKPYDWNREFKGDYVGMSLAADAKKLKLYTTAVDQVRGGDRVWFSCHGIRVNQRNRPQKRILVITDKCLFRLNDSSFKAKKDQSPLSALEGIHMSPFNDTFVVLKLKAPLYDYVVDVGVGENLVSEFVSTLSFLAGRVNGRPVPVIVEETITFNHNRTAKSKGKDHTMTFMKNPKPNQGSAFKSLKGTQTQVLYS